MNRETQNCIRTKRIERKQSLCWMYYMCINHFIVCSFAVCLLLYLLFIHQCFWTCFILFSVFFLFWIEKKRRCERYLNLIPVFGAHTLVLWWFFRETFTSTGGNFLWTNHSCTPDSYRHRHSASGNYCWKWLYSVSLFTNICIFLFFWLLMDLFETQIKNANDTMHGTMYIPNQRERTSLFKAVCGPQLVVIFPQVLHLQKHYWIILAVELLLSG